MKRVLLILMALLFCFAMVSCGPKPEPEPTPAAPTPTEAPTPSSMPVETPTPAPTQPVSFTTGLPFDGAYKPVMVSIENSSDARPQTGLQSADVVYEVPVESAITRFVCVFSDKVPEGVMPVRSGRVSFLYLQQEWNAIFMHFGGSGSGNSAAPDYTFYGNGLYKDIKIDIDGLKGKWSDYYYRVKDKIAPHNVMGNPLLAQQQYDYSPSPLNWQFDSNAAYSGVDGTQVNLKMCSNDADFVSYTYDAAQGAYLRFMNGKQFMSAETKKQVAVTNVIVQYSTYQSIDKYKVWQMTGSGNADIYIGGKLVKGTWKKDSATAPTVFYDADGKQIVLHPGNTWIHITTAA